MGDYTEDTGLRCGVWSIAAFFYEFPAESPILRA
jgi:hypothetical protein